MPHPSPPYRYRPDVIGLLWRHGVHPRETTPPELVHEFVSDLYRYELRRLRDRLVRGDIRKADYAAHVVALRRAYPLVSIAAWQWVEPDGR